MNRVVKFVSAKYKKVIPEPKFEDADKKLISEVNILLKDYIESLEACKIRSGLKIVMDISSLGNAYLQDQKLDNNLFTNTVPQHTIELADKHLLRSAPMS